ncbi:enoyl-ACP reductase FabI [Phytopseudomonas dryadis]|uniref:Enoyl-[acyl-carrier-protein] reductase [NADH] n=1 Tax=Phytopseudomonas dryadis TaxID=2487520 RepID=A0A4Q9R4G5_9GAMM|nr:MULTISPECIES: enoyl-ACP reductase FabI [Pseudomonas]TBU95386.1 enoyl-[acyl-carrier-protein] reductase FabI [Pseudomonas dryadis]TBV08187.1 enoyl-[acyl-carrier-protein] reductase FabI [Pseudomonas dryadis]TBV19811.1 enoyl-[acyl-carrier-protein] reductase FabI [Pseudomonas sp. FRB 230]
MSFTPQRLSLAGKRGLVVGIANQHSIAWGCARALHAMGAELAITWLNDKARRHVEPLADQLQAGLKRPLDITRPGELEALFEDIEQRWGRLDFLVHSLASAPKDDLRGRLLDSSSAGFLQAMDISCHSFIRMARLAEPLMERGGTLLTMSYHGAQEVIDGYALMGPVKAALEAGVRYLADELGPRGIRVHAISPGPMPTRAASGLKDFDNLLERAATRSPLRRLASLEDVGALCAWLVSDAACGQTGSVHFVDGGLNIIG